MDRKGLVSVIVPVYQAEAFLDRCVESLINQSYYDLEILLIDDSSKDRSLEKCRQWQLRDDRVKVLRHDDNKGVSYTRNRGIEQAQGEYLLFLDADDSLKREAIDSMVRSFQNTAADMCICGYETVFADHTVSYLPEVSREMSQADFYREMFWKLYNKHILHNIGTKLYKKSLITDAGIRFREEYVIYEDIIFCLEYLRTAACIAVINSPYYQYMQDNAASVTARGYKKGFFHNALVLNGILGEMIQEREQNFYINIIKNMYEAYTNEFMGETVDRKQILIQSRILCTNAYIAESKRKFTLKILPPDTRMFCRFTWYRSCRLLYLFGIWKRYRRRGKLS